MSLGASKRHHKRMNSIALFRDIKLRPNNTHIGCFSCSSNPKFHGIPTGRMNHYFPCGVVIMSLSEQPLHIGAMHQLGQCETTEVFKSTRTVIKFFVLFTAKSLDGLEVERVVHSDLGGKIEVIKGETIAKKCKFIRISAGILLNIQDVAEPLHLLGGLLPLIAAISLSQVVVLEPVRVGPDDFERLEPLVVVAPIHDFIELQLIDSGGSPRPRKVIL